METLQPFVEKVSSLSDDPRWRHVQQTMLLYGYQPHALIEVLHTVQEEFGYLDMQALRLVSDALKVRPSKVFGVATFYHLFTLTPPGRHSCVVCTGTACHIRGADKILCAIESAFSLQPGDTTPDGAATLNIARCLSFCGPAPVVEFDAVAHGNVTPDAAVDQIRGWINHDA